MGFFERVGGILGMNARNLLYIGRYNDAESRRLADSKTFAKNFLSSRDIGVPKTLMTVRNHNELVALDLRSLPNSFVIKPNAGYGGKGIVIIKERRGADFIDIDNQAWSQRQIYNHLGSILDGRYAVSGYYDIALIEERLRPHSVFRQFCDGGLPDIRIIVFNYVPVIAMLRMPTLESHGRANLHSGAIGIGINIATGAATHGIYHGKQIKRLPNGEKISSIQLPRWDEVLLIAAKAQQVTQIKFLAVDIALTSAGIKILELNARAGLSVQLANRIPLKNRLKKISDLSVASAKDGVTIAKTLFGGGVDTTKVAVQPKKQTLGLYESVNIVNTNYKHAIAKIDPHSSEVLIDRSMTEISSEQRLIDIYLAGQRLRLPFRIVDLGPVRHQLVLGGSFLKNFIIDPTFDRRTTKAVHKGSADEKMLLSIDTKLARIVKELNVLSYVRPLNLAEQQEAFLKHPTFSPRFFYRQPSFDLHKIRQELRGLPRHLDHPLAGIYLDKIRELQTTLDLISAINTPDVQRYSEQLYGSVDAVLHDTAVLTVRTHTLQDKGKELTLKQSLKIIEAYLAQHKLTTWKVEISDSLPVRIAVNKNRTLLIRSDAVFTKHTLAAALIHEIGTHGFRFENGSLQDAQIFSYGTAGYLLTEEGLAMYNQEALGVPLGTKAIGAPLRTITVHLAAQLSFKDLFHYLKEQYELSDTQAWRACWRAKRGLIDTSKKIAFTRDVVYFKGLLQVRQYVKNNPEDGLRNLYIGKIGIADLPRLGDLTQYKVRYLPQYPTSTT